MIKSRASAIINNKMKKGTKRLLGNIISAILGLYLAVTLIPQVSFEGKYYYLLLAGFILGILNLTLNPLLKLLTTPLRIISLGLLNIVINMVFVWGITIFFPGLSIPLITPLLFTTLLISGLNIFFSL